MYYMLNFVYLYSLYNIYFVLIDFFFFNVKSQLIHYINLIFKYLFLINIYVLFN